MPQAAHRRRNDDARHRWVIVAVVVLVAVLAAGGTTLVLTKTGPFTAAATPAKPPGHLDVVSATPGPDATDVAADAAISVDFTVPLAAATPMPTLQPTVDGTWTRTSPSTVSFDASGPLPPGATLSLSVPGGDDGVRGAKGQHLDQSVTTHFTVAPMSLLRVQQLLATLGYLPLSFTPADSTPGAPDESATTQVGTFAWKWSTLPAQFTALWSPGQPNLITQGAVMAFESQEHMTTDGIAGPKVWSALLQAAASDQMNTDPNYDWVDVSEALPERVRVWRDGAMVYTTLANTGISAAPTAQGTWPVYARYVATTMTGTNPDGSHYRDPGVPWVSYFHGGDALHGFIRSGYGVPQSLGCVEMPPAAAEVVYPYTPLGTLVTVE